MRSTASAGCSSPIQGCEEARWRASRPAEAGSDDTADEMPEVVGSAWGGPAAAIFSSRRALSSAEKPASSTARRPARPPVMRADSVASSRRRDMAPCSAGWAGASLGGWCGGGGGSGAVASGRRLGLLEYDRGVGKCG
ncbi:hypothetical protein GGTG_02255 [Gaeumannomyces tritici R3-111a-1]|uniref:Uncharacterized protein n=1 Tax=Gaeumannomyces tritici (strain R3-111a-1) TaxID=644352 RepID=J3NLV5_GAET3|nr:hypothetical protein GGTG_02255 [Gaeumannomyces tritici R3-111a-1]EJT82281.1 hypothetical protein GGTG_02255 [Gaeumannomyces tritici R3-111a-1]